MLMGTFRNPTEWSGAAGFEPDRATRYGQMLVGRDVNPAMENGARRKLFSGKAPDSITVPLLCLFVAVSTSFR
jgi:hypothetical protein